MGGKSRWDYLKAIYVRYQKVSKPFRARILNAFCQVCDYNRKYAIRLLNGPTRDRGTSPIPPSSPSWVGEDQFDALFRGARRHAQSL